MLPEAEPVLKIQVFEGCDQIALVCRDMTTLWEALVVLDDVIEGKRVTLRHDHLVPYEALMQVHHEPPHF